MGVIVGWEMCLSDRAWSEFLPSRSRKRSPVSPVGRVLGSRLVAFLRYRTDVFAGKRAMSLTVFAPNSRADA